MDIKKIKSLYVIAALYDFILGVAFLLAYQQIYSHFNITLPNHPGYIQFAAALVTIFGIGFWFVSQDPKQNIGIIKMGILLKVAYSGIAFFHYASGNIPGMWMPFAWMDLGFLVLFVMSLVSLNK